MPLLTLLCRDSMISVPSFYWCLGKRLRFLRLKMWHFFSPDILFDDWACRLTCWTTMMITLLFDIALDLCILPLLQMRCLTHSIRSPNNYAWWCLSLNTKTWNWWLLWNGNETKRTVSVSWRFWFDMMVGTMSCLFMPSVGYWLGLAMTWQTCGRSLGSSICLLPAPSWCLYMWPVL